VFGQIYFDLLAPTSVALFSARGWYWRLLGIRGLFLRGLVVRIWLFGFYYNDSLVSLGSLLGGFMKRPIGLFEGSFVEPLYALRGTALYKLMDFSVRNLFLAAWFLIWILIFS
jgi:hypothetical protein